MRKSELFDAYMSNSLSAEQTEELKKVLATEKGSEEFMHYVTESQLICDILDKKQAIINTDNKAKKNPFIPFIILAAAAALITLVILIATPSVTNPEITIDKKEKPSEGIPKIAPKTYMSNEIKALELVDGSIVQSKGFGEMTVFDRNKVSVKNGLFTFQVKPRKNEAAFKIQMSHGTIEVIGTAFDIVDSPERSSIKVTEGTVRFISNGKELILNAGDSASSDKSVLAKSVENLDDKIELLIDGEYTDDKKAFRDISGKKRTGWASWARGDDGAVKQVSSEDNHAIEFTNSGRLGIANFNLSGPLTLSSWVKPNGMKKLSQTILSNGDTSWRLAFFKETFKAHFAISGMSPEHVNSKQSLIPNKWSLITGVYNGSKLKIYINGVLDSEIAVSGSVGEYKGNVEVAGNHQQPNRIFEGTLDGVTVYSRALSDLEVLKLFDKGRP